jgi:hypothetical protein
MVDEGSLKAALTLSRGTAIFFAVPLKLVGLPATFGLTNNGEFFDFDWLAF